VLDALLPKPRDDGLFDRRAGSSRAMPKRARSSARCCARAARRREIEIELRACRGVEIMAPPGMEEMQQQLQSMFQNLGAQRGKARKLKVKEAQKLLAEEEAAKLINEEEMRARALQCRAERHRVHRRDRQGLRAAGGRSAAPTCRARACSATCCRWSKAAPSRPSTAPVKTDHVLFIASGAFHIAKPSDLIPELQGRFPIRVELDRSSVEDFVRILTEPDASLTTQYAALLATEGVTVSSPPTACASIAEIAFHVNERTENIGARRLHTVMERLLESVSFEATDARAQTITVDAAYVDRHLGSELAKDEDRQPLHPLPRSRCSGCWCGDGPGRRISARFARPMRRRCTGMRDRSNCARS
jgi:ATP-dependent HslUV protease ATP-binding subunit HslU